MHIHHDHGLRISHGGYTYIKMPKCASDSIQSAITSKDYKYLIGRPEQDGNFFTVIRDPLDRWVSGVCEYLNRQADGTDKLIINTLDAIATGSIIFDEHTIPMTYFLYPFNGYNITYFRMSNNIFDEINTTFDLDLAYKHSNKSIKNNGLYYALKSICMESRFRATFNQIYKDDIVLFNNFKLQYSDTINLPHVKQALQEHGFVYR